LTFNPLVSMSVCAGAILAPALSVLRQSLDEPPETEHPLGL
jgi:hypothetical protein